MNCISPRMFELFPELPRLRKPAAAEDAMPDFVAVLITGRSLLTPDL